MRPIQLLNISPATKSQLMDSGLRCVGDFFSASPREITQEWTGNWLDLKNIVRKALRGIRSTSNKDIEYVAKAALNRGDLGLLEGLSLYEITAIGMLQSLGRVDESIKETVVGFIGLEQEQLEIRQKAYRKIFDNAIYELKSYFTL